LVSGHDHQLLQHLQACHHRHHQLADHSIRAGVKVFPYCSVVAAFVDVHVFQSGSEVAHDVVVGQKDLLVLVSEALASATYALLLPNPARSLFPRLAEE